MTTTVLTPTTVTCIKGRRNELGPDLSLAPDIVYIGRHMHRGGWLLPGSDWCNPYPVGRFGIERSLELFREYIAQQDWLLARLGEIRGRELGCWCADPGLCHGLILAELADRSAS